MEFVVNDPNAVLMKLIPSVQHINLRDPRHKDYYESLAKNQMPLLCHVGPEYSFPEGIRERERDNFRFLDKPLEYGVTVIAAHCATPVFPIDKDETKEFGAFMKSANSGGKIRLWGDTSAFSLLTRIPILEEILETFPPEWLVHGSDFPIPIEGWVTSSRIYPRCYVRGVRTDKKYGEPPGQGCHDQKGPWVFGFHS